MIPKFQINDRVGYTEKRGSVRTGFLYYTKSGTILEIALPGEHISRTSQGKEIRYRIKWDDAPRTWMRESTLVKI